MKDNKKRILAIVLTVTIIAGATVGVAAAVRRTTSNSTVPVYEASNFNDGGWSGSINEMEGVVTSDVSQDVYLTEEDTVEEVLVSEGQQVKEGDLLIRYDQTKTSLALEKQKLTVEEIDLAIEVAMQNLETLKRIRPYSESGGGGGGGYDFGPEEEDIPEEDTSRVGKYGNQKAKEELKQLKDAYNEKDADGTEENPYRFLCKDGTKITSSFLKSLGDHYFILESRDGDELKGDLAGVFFRKASKITIKGDWSGKLNFSDLTLPIVILDPPEEDPEDVTPTPTSTEDVSPTPTSAGDVSPTPTTAPTATVTQTPIPTESGSTPEEGEGASGGASANGTSPKVAGLLPVFSWRMTRPLADAEEGESEGGSGSGVSSVGLISPSAEYTKEELAEEIKSQEETLRDLKLDLREAMLRLHDAEVADKEGEVRAKMNGVVKHVGDPRNPLGDGSAFLSVAGTGGQYVRGGLSELLLDEVKEGDPVMVMSWDTGESYEGTIKEISPYPDTSGYFSGWGSSASATYYPFVVWIEEGAENLTNNSWVQLTIESSMSEEEMSMEMDSDTLYLYKAFILEENGHKYVYKRGEDELLHKIEIKTGALSGQGFEIKDGVTMEDYIAFPYGKAVKEGAKTRIASTDELY